MVWFNVDDNMAFHSKVIQAGNAAIGLWTRAGAWCCHTLTDGFVPKPIARSLGTIGQCKALVSAGLWLEVDGGYQFHEWDQRQQTKEDVELRRKAERDRKAEQRKRSRVPGGQPRDVPVEVPPESDEDAPPDVEADGAPGSTQASGVPFLSLPFPSSSSGYVGGESLVAIARENDPPPRSCAKHKTLNPDCVDCAAVDAEREAWLRGLIAANEPSRYCPRHPNGTEAPCRDCQTARQIHERWSRDRESAVAERKRAAGAAQSAAAHQAAGDRARAIANCTLGCAGLGGYLDDGHGGRALCDHRPPNPGRPSLREQFEAHKRDQAPSDPERAEDLPPDTEERFSA